MGLFSIFGGGKSKAPPAPRAPVEDPNTLRSKATARILFAVAEGPVAGIVGTDPYATGAAWKGTGAQNIFFGETPLENKDGTRNFPGVEWEYRSGTPDQPWIAGFPAVESTRAGEIGLPLEIPFSRPATRSVTNTNANAVRIRVGVQALIDQNPTTGDTHGSHVVFAVRIRRQGRAAWDIDRVENIGPGKTTSAYEQDHRFELPGEGPWDVQVARLTPDPNRATLRNEMAWISITDIIDEKLQYPNTALLALYFDAELFGGGGLPTVTARWRGWMCRVPTNYDPVGRTYNGVWQGGYRLAFTSNPAWLFLQLLTHPSGAALPDSMVDRYALYSAAQYCDGYVPSGRKNASGTDILEPRFEAHFNINTREETFSVLNALASCFRAMAYWAGGAVRVVQDGPRDADVLVNPTDTVGGFNFAGSAQKAIHTVALVSFLDADNFDKVDIETYEDPQLIERYGWRQTEVTAFACKSRGQAYRLGKWIIETEKLGDALTYKTSLSHLNANPGDVIKLTSPQIAGVRMGGRIVSATASAAVLDAPVTLEAGRTYHLNAVLPDDTVAERPVVSGAGTTTSLRVNPPFPLVPMPEAKWVLRASNLAPQQFRMVGIADEGGGVYNVAAVPHDPTIYARVERDVRVATDPITRLPDLGVVQPPANVRVDRQYVSTPSGWTTALEIRWDPSPDAFIRGYLVRYRRNDGNFSQLVEQTGTVQTLYGESSGRFTIHVQAVNFAGVLSRPAILDVTVSDTSPITLVRPTGLELEGQGNDTAFSTRNPKFTWRGTAVRGAFPLGTEPVAGAGYLDDIFRDYEVRVLVANRVVFVDHVGETHYTFTFERNAATPGGPHRAFKVEVYMRDRWGNYSLPAALEVANPAPPQPTNLKLLAGVGTVFISFDRPADPDFEGALVWSSDASGFPTNPETLKYQGTDTYTSIQAPGGRTAYVRVAAYDSFGMVGINVSAEVAVAVGGVKEPDAIPPAVPAGLALSATASRNDDGSYVYRLRADWGAVADDDFLLYGVAIAEEPGNFISYTTNETSYEWVATAGAAYRVKVQSVDNLSNRSAFSAEAGLTVPGNGIPPANPTALTVVPGTLRTVWLQWPPHPDADWDHMEVWEADTNNREQATRIHNAAGTTFARQGLPAGATRHYWIRAANRSKVVSGFFPASATGGRSATTSVLAEGDFAPLVVKDAFIDSVNAQKIQAGTVLSGQVIVDGRSLSSISEANGDPAQAINRGTTTLDPGKITISGGTTLANWRSGSDTTKLDGGNISANSIRANALAIGNRNVEFSGMTFGADKATATASWTAGTVVYVNDAGAAVNETVAAGSRQYAGQTLYLYWRRGSGMVQATTEQAIHADNNAVVLGTYTGGVGLFVNYGMTTVDGSTIRTGTVTADRLQANSITARELSTGVLITNNAQIGQAVVNEANIVSSATLDGYVRNLTADKIRSGVFRGAYIQVGGERPGAPAPWWGSVIIEGRGVENRIEHHDAAGVIRVHIGKIGGNDNPALDGLYVRDQNGKDILTANGLGVEIAGTDNIVPGATSGSGFTDGFFHAYRSVTGSLLITDLHLLVELGSHDLTLNKWAPTRADHIRTLITNANGADNQIIVPTDMSGIGRQSRIIRMLVQPPAGETVTFQVQQRFQDGSWGAVPNGYAYSTGSFTTTEYKR